MGIHLILPLCKWLEQTPVGAAVHESLWLFPVIEIFHLLGMALLVGTIAAFDLRLIGLALRSVPVKQLARRLLPWSWVGFAVQAITGALLLSSEATRMYANPAFRIKMLFIAFAGLQALFFHWFARHKIPDWSENENPPRAARVSGVVSILTWAAVIAAGRMIGFM